MLLHVTFRTVKVKIEEKNFNFWGEIFDVFASEVIGLIAFKHKKLLYFIKEELKKIKFDLSHCHGLQHDYEIMLVFDVTTKQWMQFNHWYRVLTPVNA